MFSVKEQVTRLFIASDQRDWETVLSIFSEEVELDYSSMSGQPGAMLLAKDIVTAWKGILPGFEFTHHQIGNVISYETEETASVFAYGTATHYLDKSVWTVVGSYDFDLKKINKEWRVTTMKFNFKYQDGNVELPAKAIEIATK